MSFNGEQGLTPTPHNDQQETPHKMLMIRSFQAGDAEPLREVFYSSVHDLTGEHYTAEQRAAWAPLDYDREAWRKLLHTNQPFVVEVSGALAAYADLQPTGYIDHFYVAGPFAGQGIGRRLMQHLLTAATAQGVPHLWSHVSLSAELFFLRSGFSIESRRSFLVRGVTMTNAHMRRALLP